MVFRSGIEEPVSEKDELLREASMLNFEFKNKGTKRKIPTRDQTITDHGKKARDKYSSIFIKENFTNQSDISENTAYEDINLLEEHCYGRLFYANCMARSRYCSSFVVPLCFGIIVIRQFLPF